MNACFIIPFICFFYLAHASGPRKPVETKILWKLKDGREVYISKHLIEFMLKHNLKLVLDDRFPQRHQKLQVMKG